MLYEPRLFGPLIATMVRGVPHKLRDLKAPDGTHIRIVFHDPNQALSLVREDGLWQLGQPVPESYLSTELNSGSPETTST